MLAGVDMEAKALSPPVSFAGKGPTQSTTVEADIPGTVTQAPVKRAQAWINQMDVTHVEDVRHGGPSVGKLPVQQLFPLRSGLQGLVKSAR